MNIEELRYASFWIKDQYNNLIEYTCNPSMLNSICVNNNPESPFDITPVFFKRGVLSKYMNSPHKYIVSDGQIQFIEEGIYLRVDTDRVDYVAVLLVDLASLDYEEQLYWRSFNIKPNDSTAISTAAYQRWFEAQFANPELPDAVLIQKYIKFYKLWNEKVGWHLFREDPDDPKSILYSLHMLSDVSNEKEFYEQILVVTKLFIESLNVKQFPKLEEKANGSLNRFSMFLKQNNINASNLMEFLRKLQRLRSTSAAHSGTIEKSVAEYFGIGINTYGYILGSIFSTLSIVIDTLSEIVEIISVVNTSEK